MTFAIDAKFSLSSAQEIKGLLMGNQTRCGPEDLLLFLISTALGSFLRFFMLDMLG